MTPSDRRTSSNAAVNLESRSRTRILGDWRRSPRCHFRRTVGRSASPHAKASHRLWGKPVPRPLRYDRRSMGSRHISGGVVHELPPDLRRVLTADPKVLAAWESLTPLARNEWICWVLWPKKAETRGQHIERLQSELLEGKRRPCCWVGCVHRRDKELSPSVRWVLSRSGRAPGSASAK